MNPLFFALFSRHASTVLRSTPDDYEVSLSGLRWKDEVVGAGDAPQVGDLVFVDYVGTLAANEKQFDSSYDRGSPLAFPLGQGKVIPGWDEGVASMKVGGKRTLLIPPHLAYGPRAVGSIPANSELKFVVELQDVKSGFFPKFTAQTGAFLQNLAANFGPNPFTFFVAIFVILNFAPLFLPDESPLMYGDMPNPFTGDSPLEADMDLLKDRTSS